MLTLKEILGLGKSFKDFTQRMQLQKSAVADTAYTDNVTLTLCIWTLMFPVKLCSVYGSNFRVQAPLRDNMLFETCVTDLYFPTASLSMS